MRQYLHRLMSLRPHLKRINMVFSHASAKAEHELCNLSCMCRPFKTPSPPRKWHIHWEFLDFKPGFWITTKISIQIDLFK